MKLGYPGKIEIMYPVEMKTVLTSTTMDNFPLSTL